MVQVELEEVQEVEEVREEDIMFHTMIRNQESITQGLTKVDQLNTFVQKEEYQAIM